MKLKFAPSCIFLLLLNVFSVFAQKGHDRSIFEIKIYHISSPDQEKSIDQFLEKAYIPAMHDKGIKHIGVFKPIASDELNGKRIYVFTPYSSANEYMDISSNFHLEDLKNGKDYQYASHENPPFDRIESILLKAFSDMPGYDVPKLKGPKENRIYELRSYESPTEKLFHNKVKMFNSGEVEIFDNLGFNAIFYGEVIAGSSMPNLMYMTSFDNMAAEEAKWKAFSDDPAWNKLKVDPEYQNNVSHIDKFLLYPTDYSEL
ncbi:NIPSNAP family protein [Echinicola marina]|uniref:NIPSNAP family protein n=1 Tax=Echinicola marina TaxID=2859768 RepID=UPI001CF7174C|nr:NIPSNAP family protein [Echinicola marina]UCS92617.1 NIPSNAP family protein [Echinicola marina]